MLAVKIRERAERFLVSQILAEAHGRDKLHDNQLVSLTISKYLMWCCEGVTNYNLKSVEAKYPTAEALKICFRADKTPRR